MNDISFVAETATRLFGEICTTAVLEAAEKGVWGTAVWDALEQTGLHLVSIPEAIGGVGGSLYEAVTVLRVSAQHAAPLPLAELFLAGWLLGELGIGLPKGKVTLAIPPASDSLRFEQSDASWHVSGTIRQVPFARHVDYALVVDSEKIGLIELAQAEIIPHQNLAQEPRDTVKVTQASLPVAHRKSQARMPVLLKERGALFRTAQMVGALEAILARSIRYVGEREQFGRPIGKFQAIQQYLAELAGEVVAARGAMETAVLALEQDPTTARAAIAMAKIRAGEAAGTGSRIAHQVHGAMGFTHEYPLHYFTKRLWAWRDEYGSETEWAEWLGQQVVANGADNLWDFIVST